MWEIRERDKYDRNMRNYKTEDEAYECGYEDGWEDAMEKMNEEHSYKMSSRSYRGSSSSRRY